MNLNSQALSVNMVMTQDEAYSLKAGEKALTLFVQSLQDFISKSREWKPETLMTGLIRQCEIAGGTTKNKALQFRLSLTADLIDLG